MFKTKKIAIANSVEEANEMMLGCWRLLSIARKPNGDFVFCLGFDSVTLLLLEFSCPTCRVGIG